MPYKVVPAISGADAKKAVQAYDPKASVTNPRPGEYHFVISDPVTNIAKSTARTKRGRKFTSQRFTTKVEAWKKAFEYLCLFAPRLFFCPSCTRLRDSQDFKGTLRACSDCTSR